METTAGIAEFRDARSRIVGTVGLVPTMGYLHEGHLTLVRRARAESHAVAVSIFVNPSQFGPAEDLDAYPRDMERDLNLLAAEGVDLVFAPPASEIYPTGFDTWIEPGDIAQRLEGTQRPGHFRGVATVVAKLFNVVRPDRAYFGQKDGQQVAVIKRMAADLDMGIDIVVVPTVREPDGLALSSRNVYLDEEQRRAAPVVYRALCRALDLWEQGERNGERLRRETRQVLESEPFIDGIDYVSVAGLSDLRELDAIDRPAMVSTAVHLARTRLIDNVILE